MTDSRCAGGLPDLHNGHRTPVTKGPATLIWKKGCRAGKAVRMNFYTPVSSEAMVYEVDVKALAKADVSKKLLAEVAHDIAVGNAIPKKMTQKQAADMLHVSQSYVSKLGAEKKAKAMKTANKVSSDLVEMMFA
jgi:predicted XRE-type DNA-binding protein